MRSSSFEETITCQFDALMKIVMKRTLTDHKRAIARRSKRELPFCAFDEPLNICGVNDAYSSDVIQLRVCGMTIPVSNDELAKAVQRLTSKQYEAVLLYYFVGMNDREIAELFSVTRSTICSRRHKGLKRLKRILEERTCKANE